MVANLPSLRDLAGTKMKTGKLNLADRQSWSKFQHILTSFASDYIALVAPERTKFTLEQQSLVLTFSLIKSQGSRADLNQFTYNLEQFVAKLELIGISEVRLHFVSAGEVPSLLFEHRFAIDLIAPSSLAVRGGSLAKTPKNQRRSLGRSVGRSLGQTFGKLSGVQIRRVAQATSALVVRDPKGTLVQVGTYAKQNFVAAIDWVDNFPWETWKNSILEAQKRRHARNLVKALIEDALILAALLISLLWGMNSISFASVDVATMPVAHFDRAVGEQKYRCGLLPGVNKRNYLCLARNMSYKQVSSILGGDGKPVGLNPEYGKQAVTITWKTWTGGSLNAIFAGDRLVARAYQNI
ncbi:MAG: hypothetical protein SFT94_12485 [Pseudanabaenaceae cyanobacterium bins.68]|nr:hypothetical protein [Pseudanabaenaceae cyanobacterium bins.68]